MTRKITATEKKLLDNMFEQGFDVFRETSERLLGRELTDEEIDSMLTVQDNVEGGVLVEKSTD